MIIIVIPLALGYEINEWDLSWHTVCCLQSTVGFPLHSLSYGHQSSDKPRSKSQEIKFYKQTTILEILVNNILQTRDCNSFPLSIYSHLASWN